MEKKELQETVDKVEKKAQGWFKTKGKDFFWKALKIVIGVAALIFLLKTMGYTAKDAASEGKSEIVAYWTSLWALILTSFKESFKQVIMNFHQTIVILIAAWLFATIKKIWSMAQGKIFSLLDVVLGNYSNKKRALIKEDIKKIVDANIDLIENAFKNNVLDTEEADEEMVKSQHKLSSVLTLTLHDLAKSKVDRELLKEYDRKEIVDMLVLEVEKELLKKKSSKEESAFAFASAMESDGGKNIKPSDGLNVRAIVKKMHKSLPEEYRKGIEEAVKNK